MKNLFKELMSLHTALDGGEKTFRKIINIGLIIGTFLFAVALIIMILDFKTFRSFEPDLAKFGAIGDFLGGILSPILAFLVLLVLLGTTRLQKEELTEMRRELQANTKATQYANIENVFFQLFNLLQQSIGANGSEKISSELLSNVSNQCSEISAQEYYNGNPDHRTPNGWGEILETHPNEMTAIRSVLLENYNFIYSKHQAELGRYFRLLYNVLRFLADKEEQIPKEMYETYFKIVRASISNYELLLIMVNCFTEAGFPMKKYVSKFELFDNLPKSILIVPVRNEYGNIIGELDLTILWAEFDEKSFGDNVDFF